MVEIAISGSIFEKEPTFRRGIVIARRINNRGADEELTRLLERVTLEAVRNPVDLGYDGRVVVWTDAHRRFGSNPKRFPPAHIALRKRVQQARARLPFISKVVAIMNACSIEDTIPVGGDDMGRAIEHAQRLELRLATGDETFVPLGRPGEVERPEPGEIIYAVGHTVMCRRWNWCNGHITRITEDTNMLVMNTDGLGENSEACAIRSRDRVARLLEQHCGAEVVTALLSPDRPNIIFDLV